MTLKTLDGVTDIISELLVALTNVTFPCIFGKLSLF